MKQYRTKTYYLALASETWIERRVYKTYVGISRAERRSYGMLKVTRRTSFYLIWWMLLDYNQVR